MIQLNAKDLYTVLVALRYAAEMYDGHALACKGEPRLVDQFKRQAQDARRIADSLE